MARPRPARRATLGGLAGAIVLALSGTGPAAAATTVDFTGSVGPAIRVVPKNPLPVSLGIKLGISSDTPGELPATLDRTTILFPYGSQLNSRLFPSCSAAALNRRGLRACSKASRIGSGFAVGVGDTVRQRLTATLFNSPGSRQSITFHLSSTNPLRVNTAFSAPLTTLRGGKYQYRLQVDVPPEPPGHRGRADLGHRVRDDGQGDPPRRRPQAQLRRGLLVPARRSGPLARNVHVPRRAHPR